MFKKPEMAAMAGVLIAATAGLVAAFVLSYEALMLASGALGASCDVNAVLSCSVVAKHWSASVLGFPNSFIGLMAMPVVMTIAVVVLSGAKLPKWFMRATQIGAIGGLLFALWMFYMSFVEIGVLCPWCLLTDAAMLGIFFGVTRYNVLVGNCFSEKINKKLLPCFKKGYDQLLLWVLVTLALVAIIAKFGSELFA